MIDIINKITDSIGVNVGLVGAFLGQALGFLEGIVPVMLGLISCCVGGAFFVVHLKTIKLKTMEIERLERDNDKSKEKGV